MPYVLILLSACKGCFNLDVPDPNDNVETGDTEDSETTDSEDSTPRESQPDTGPPAMCAVVEAEPNNSLEQSQVLPLETWACGDIENYVDADFFSVSADESGWIQVKLEAAERGSSADVQLNVYDDDQSAFIQDGFLLNADPNLMFPASAGESFGLVVSEQTNLYGDNYFWYMMATLAKSPVDWTREEVEDNSAQSTAELITAGETVFGTIDEAGDYDWYHLTTPADATSVTLKVIARASDSPADLTLIFYDSAGTEIRKVYNGDADYNPDPLYEEKLTGQVDWYLQLKEVNGKGSRFHWYTFSVEVGYDSADTGN